MLNKYLKQQRILHAWKTFWQQHSLLSLFLLFIFTFCFLFWIQSAKTFADPDSFYHAKIIWLMKEKIINGQLPTFQQFPWLYYTVLKTNYIDHHFLYHLLSIPFLYFTALVQYFMGAQNFIGFQNFEPILVGFKLATISWATLFIIIFYFVLKKLKTKGAIFYSLLLLITNPFLFRLSLGKATAISLIFIWLGIYLCYRCRDVALQRLDKDEALPRLYGTLLFLLSFFYVWLYGGWPLMLVIVSIFIMADAVTLTLLSKGLTLPTAIKNSLLTRVIRVVKNFISLLFTKHNIKLFLITLAGLTAGLIINPYFPKNLTFYYHQIYQIAIVNYQDILNVGGEWYPYNFFELLSVSSPAFLLTIPALIFFVGNLFYAYRNIAPKQTLLSRGLTKNAPPVATEWVRGKKYIFNLIFSFILAIIFLILTLRSRRNVEYLFPFLIFFIASSFTLAIKNFYQPVFWQKTINSVIKKWLASGLIIGFFCVALSYIVWRDVTSVKHQSTNGFTWNTWQGASEWLKNNTQKGDIIFHSDWDDWPFLFFHNDQNYYIVGLDPTFMYKFDAELYQEWSDATLGQNTTALNTLLPEKFNSQYILVDTDHSTFEQQIITDGNFEKVFSDERTKIYKLNL